MRKEFIYLVFVVLLLSPAFITFGIQLGDFENDMDGWRVADSRILTGFSTHGATSNQYSIWVETPAEDQDVLVLNLIGNNLVDEFRNNLKISMDITRLVSEWNETGDSRWCNLYLGVSAGSEGEEGSWNYSEEMDEPGNWATGYGDDPINFVYDYSLVHDEIDYDNLEYLELTIVSNWGGFDPGGVYYIDNIQMYGEGLAYDPQPADGERDLSTNTTLSWTPGVHADKHDIYFGTNFNDVNDANNTNVPDGVIFIQNQELNSFDPDGLVPGTNYFWRIDEVNDTNIWKGDIWNFTTAYPGKDLVIGDFEDNMDNWVVNTDNATYITFSYSETGATLNNTSLKMDLTEDEAVGWAWLIYLVLTERQVEAFKNNDLLSIDVTWVASEWEGHSWSQVQQIALNTDAFGWAWRDLTPPDFDTGNPEDPGAWDPITSPEEIHTRTITWDYYSSFSVDEIPVDSTVQLHFSQGHDASIGPVTYYFDNIRFRNSNIPSNPNPAYQEQEVRTEPTLSWDPGRDAVSYNVYLGTNFNDVNAVNQDNLSNYPNVTYANVEESSYKTETLEYNTTYYWRIDGINDDNPNSPWEGVIWSFTTGNFITVEDFESYNDYPPDEVWMTWLDGYDNPLNGSSAGHPDPDFVFGEHYLEDEIVYTGRWSMPLFYDNSVAQLSEVTRMLNADWTVNDAVTLTLFYHGDPDNAPEPMYIVIDNVVVTNEDANAALVTEWTQWDIPLQQLADQGVNLNNVRSITIGFGNKTNPTSSGGSGHVFFDDIRLYLP